MIKKIFVLAVLVIIIFTAMGCQTVAGLGGDIKWTAERTAELIEP